MEDIIQKPTPQDKQDLQRFLGISTYLSSHALNFSSHTATLRDLLKDLCAFQLEWGTPAQLCSCEKTTDVKIHPQVL